VNLSLSLSLSPSLPPSLPLPPSLTLSLSLSLSLSEAHERAPDQLPARVWHGDERCRPKYSRRRPFLLAQSQVTILYNASFLCKDRVDTNSDRRSSRRGGLGCGISNFGFRLDGNNDERSSRRGGVLQTIQDIQFPLDQFGNTGDLIKPLLRSTWRPVTAAILDHPHPGVALSVDICPVQCMQWMCMYIYVYM
jgi:hypothetical protein